MAEVQHGVQGTCAQIELLQLPEDRQIMQPTRTFSKEYLVKTEIPPMSANVLRITKLLDDMSVSQRKIAEAISFDPVLTARILKLANSVTFSLQKPVLHLPTAVATVGNNSIYATIMMNGLSDAFGRKILDSDTGKKIWLHLLATAMLSRDMCNLAGLRGMDEAFCCGLLHDIGQLIFLRSDFPLYTSVLDQVESDHELLNIERETFGFDHAELGATAAKAWNLPAAICEMIRFHHTPNSLHSGTSIGRIVEISDRLAHLKSNGLACDDLVESETVAAFGFTAPQFEALWEDVLVRIEEALPAFE
jgi:putative nucleotidyltransferase with HDIG domain